MSPVHEASLIRGLHQRAADRVSFGAGPALTARSLLARAAAVAARLPEPTPGSEVAFAFGHDREAFAAALLGTWARGHVAALPLDADRENVLPVLERSANVAFLHDTGVGRGLFVPPLVADVTEGPQLEEVERAGPVLAVFRPGEAEPARVLDAAELAALVAESLESLPREAGAAVGSTLTPGAWPGLVEGLLAPLASGRFQARTPGTPSSRTRGAAEEAALLAESGATACVVPRAHARALAALPAGALGPLSTLLVVDGSLDVPHRGRLQEVHGVRTLDGGPPRDLAPEAHRLEQVLLSLDSVEDVCCHRLPGSSTLLVAVAAPGDPGELEESLLERVRGQAPPSLELEVRVVPELPRDANGRVPLPRLHLLFGLGRDGAPLERALTWVALPTGDGDARSFRTRIPERYAWFEGHFPPYPVLAGAVQLQELVLPRLRQAWPGTGPPRRISALKFLGRIEPGDEIELGLRRTGEETFTFEITGPPGVAGERRRLSAGRLTCAGEGARS